MAVVLKSAPQGIDTTIDAIQNKMYSYLSGQWSNYQSYHRAYINPRANGTIFEFYTGNREYTDLLYNDKFDVTSFFVADNNRSFDINNGTFTQKISIIFQAHIQKLYPTITHRADEEMHKDIFIAIKKTGYDSYIKSIVTGVDNVFNDLNIPGEIKDKVSIHDMSNFHIVKLDLEIPFRFSNC